jgi:YaiO family outer membrane protein
LTTQYPYNDKIKSSLGEELFATGKKYQRNKQNDSALAYFRSAYDLNPSDTFSLYRMISLRLAQKEYDSTSQLIEAGLNVFPDNNFLYYKKGELNEQLKDYDTAYHYIKLAESQYGNNFNYFNYLDYLKSKTYKNQAGVMFLRSFFDSTQLRSSIASFEYTRFQPLNTYIFRLNYAARPIGNGMQQEIEWLYKINTKLYTQATIAYANKYVFPKLRVSASVFNNLVYDWETEIGLRYALQRDNVSLTSLIGGVAKSWDDIWINFRGFVMTDFNKVYQTILFQSRYYFNYKNDFLFATASLGTPPEDRALEFQVNTFLNYTTRMVGAGYQHKIKHRTTILLQGNWYNFKIKQDYYVNQYNVFISLLTRL